MSERQEPKLHGNQQDSVQRSTMVDNDIDLERGSAVDPSRPDIHHVHSHVSVHDMEPTRNEHVEANAAQFERFSPRRKVGITAILALCSFLSPLSSTSILSAVPEVAKTYNSTGSVINISNALYMFMMGISPCIWGPLSQIYGRRWVRNSLLSSAPSLKLIMRLDLYQHRSPLYRV